MEPLVVQLPSREAWLFRLVVSKRMQSKMLESLLGRELFRLLLGGSRCARNILRRSTGPWQDASFNRELLAMVGTFFARDHVRRLRLAGGLQYFLQSRLEVAD